MPQITVIIPLFNEMESLVELHAWLARVFNSHRLSYELIFIDDGSTDQSWEMLEKISSSDKNTRAIRLRKNYGKSAALNIGFSEAEGDVVITMDADLQDSPDELPELYRMITAGGYDLVSGWKKKRFDPITKTIPSKLFNYTTSVMSGVRLNDFNCGLKAYKKEVVKSIDIYGEMHRYIPVIAKWAGFTRIGEKVVQHQKRKYGITKFGLERFIHGFLDFLTVGFIVKYMKRPMHFFGTVGLASFMIGTLLGLYLTYLKLFEDEILTKRPMLFLVVLLIILGLQFFFIGLFAELISRNSSDKGKYLIEKRI